jgi:imidazolonepropionase-like amidohydrolase
MIRGLIAAALLAAAPAQAAPRILTPPTALKPDVQALVKVSAPRLFLMGVRVIDGTGAPPLENRIVILSGGRIEAVMDAMTTKIGPGPEDKVLDLSGHTVLPGLVGLHNHMYYIARPNLDAHGHSDAPLVVPQMTFSAPRLYLAAGVTTIRTTGSVEPYADLNLKTLIDTGVLPGPHMDVTAPYLEGANSPFIQMHRLTGPEDARRTVAFWADQGATSFKAYMNITRADLGAAIDEAHKRGLKVTGHLCSVTYPEAAQLGIDNLEHGFYVNTQLDPGKQPDVCPTTSGGPTILGMTPDSPAGSALIRQLVARKVAITSTLPVFEQRTPWRTPLNARAMAVLSPPAREAYLYARNLASQAPRERYAEATKMLANTMAMERAFVRAGGLLVAGPDPTGNGGVIPGFGDHRAIELLVDAGFTPMEAIRIGTLNGATYLGLADQIGSVTPGKIADLLVVRGDPGTSIADIENVAIVFKDGIGYDPDKLLETVRGRYGQY